MSHSTFILWRQRLSFYTTVYLLSLVDTWKQIKMQDPELHGFSAHSLYGGEKGQAFEGIQIYDALLIFHSIVDHRGLCLCADVPKWFSLGHQLFCIGPVEHGPFNTFNEDCQEWIFWQACNGKIKSSRLYSVQVQKLLYAWKRTWPTHGPPRSNP